MILDSLENTRLYETIHPRFKQAFDFLRNTDLLALPLGKIELDGLNLFVNVVEIQGNIPNETRVETHNNYIDIQVPLSVDETIGWIAGNELKKATTPYNAEKDITFFADKATNLISVRPFQFVVFFPEDGHQPGISDGLIKKLIVKVLL